MPASEEKGSFLRIDDYVFLSIDVPTGKLTEEEQLALVLNASMDTIWKSAHLDWQAFLFIEAYVVYAFFKLFFWFTVENYLDVYIFTASCTEGPDFGLDKWNSRDHRGSDRISDPG